MIARDSELTTLLSSQFRRDRDSFDFFSRAAIGTKRNVINAGASESWKVAGTYDGYEVSIESTVNFDGEEFVLPVTPVSKEKLLGGGLKLDYLD